MSVLFFFIGILPYFIYFNLSYGGLPFISTPSYGFGTHGFTPFYVNVMPTIFASMIPSITTSWIFQVLLILFIAGLAYIVVNLFLGWDLIKKEHSLKSYAFLLAWMVVPFIFFSLISQAEDRYLFMVYPAMFMVACLVLFKCYDFIKKNNKYAAIAFVLVILFLTAYAQISYGDQLVKFKASSYVQFRESGLWIKERSGPSDLILNSGVPENTYYSERNTTFYPENEADFDKFIVENRPRFMVLSRLEPSPQWTYAWPESHQDKVVPVQAYYMDEAKQQPILIIYEFVYNGTS
jgi:4-amino-4-deoxy-L-arabinose transferase-like glycosyltransferase